MRKPRFRGIAQVLVVGLGAAFLTAPVLAQPSGGKPPSPSERRQALKPVFLALQQDPEFLRFQRDLRARPDDVALQESYLRFLPLSPLDYLALDMEVRLYEVPVPLPIYEEHLRWVRLHETKARELYGDAQVDRLLAGWPAEVRPPLVRAKKSALQSLTESLLLGTNRNLAATDSPPPNEYQGEIQVAVNPNNPNQIVAASNTWDAPASCGSDLTVAIFSSSDGGATWSYTCAPGPSAYSSLGLGPCFGFSWAGDPAVFWDDQNRVVLNHMMICSDIRTFTAAGLAVASSTDGGATWAAHGLVSSWDNFNFDDKNLYAIDNHPASPFHGRHYVCWDRFNQEKVAYSPDGGASWTEVDLPPAPIGSLELFCEMAVADDGTVHLIFDAFTCGSEACTNEVMFHTKSVDGGVSWSAPVQVRDYNLRWGSGANCPAAQDDRCINPFGAIGVDTSGGACDGNLYVTFTDFPTGTNVNSADVWVTRSTDGGATWSAPVRVNDDGLPNRTQFHPFLQVDSGNGHVVVAWQDTRNHPNNDGLDFFAARSTDCGASFETNVQVSQPSPEFNNAGISHSNHNSVANPNFNPNQTGEYMGLDVLGGKAYVAWSDTRHYFPGFTTEPQRENLGFAIVDFTGGPPAVCGNGVKESGEACDGADLGGQTCQSRGFSGGTLTCNPNCSFNTSGCTITFTTETFTSLAAEDGYLLESTETSNQGGSANSNDSSADALRAGDDRKDKQFRSVLSFDTSSLPDGAAVQTVTLRLRRGTVAGTDPFTTHGSLTADVRNGGFNGNLALETSDFQATATASDVCTLTNAPNDGDWSECTFNVGGIAAVNKGGRTQVRVRFTVDDDDDQSNDYLGYYSGNNATAANHPQLVVTYLP